MTNKFFLVSFLAAAILPFAGIAAMSRVIVNPSEEMVLVPGLAYLGKSRISTVRFCSTTIGTDYRNLITDSDFELMEQCLKENT